MLGLGKFMVNALSSCQVAEWQAILATNISKNNHLVPNHRNFRQWNAKIQECQALHAKK
jgi:hypothetical protein